MGNVDRGDNFKEMWVTEDSVNSLHILNSSRGTEGSGIVSLVHKAARLIPRSTSVHIRPRTRLGRFAPLSRTQCNTFSLWAFVAGVPFLEAYFTDMEIVTVLPSSTYSLIPVPTAFVSFLSRRFVM